MTYNIDTSDGYSIEGGFYPLNWKTEPPTKEGWYWVYTKDIGALIVEIDIINNKIYIDKLVDYDIALEAKDVLHWLGPLPEPNLPTIKT